MTLRIIITGGTFDKRYDAIRGQLTFQDTHLPDIIEQGRTTLRGVETDGAQRQIRFVVAAFKRVLQIVGSRFHKNLYIMPIKLDAIRIVLFCEVKFYQIAKF